MHGWDKIILLLLIGIVLYLVLYYFAYCKKHELNESKKFNLVSGDHNISFNNRPLKDQI